MHCRITTLLSTCSARMYLPATVTNTPAAGLVSARRTSSTRTWMCSKTKPTRCPWTMTMTSASMTRPRKRILLLRALALRREHQFRSLPARGRTTTPSVQPMHEDGLTPEAGADDLPPSANDNFILLLYQSLDDQVQQR